MSGVIYKIVTGNDVYVGSTTNYKKRIISHKSNIYNENRKDYNAKLYKTIRANECDWEMSIYEQNLSMTKEELRIREEEVRLLLGATLNCKRAHRTYKQMREAKTADVSKWVSNNREKVNEYRKTLVKCECGLMITRGAIFKHKKSAKHARLMT